MQSTKRSLFPYYTKVDLSDRENYRVYVFADGEVRIDNPQFLIVSDNGHRVWDGKIAHYIPYGWIHLYWQPQGDQTFYCERGNTEESADSRRQC